METRGLTISGALSGVRASFLVALLPWLVFLVSDRNGGIGRGDSSVLAAVVSLTLIADAARQRRLSPLPSIGLVLFGGIAVLTAVAGPGLIEDYSRTFVVGVLALAFAVSRFRTPMTLHYLRARVPRARIESDEFLAANRQLTSWWTCCMAATAASLGIGAHSTTALPVTVWNWIVPMALVFLAGTMTARVREGDAYGLPDSTGRGIRGLLDIDDGAGGSGHLQLIEPD